jgi:hypothetical protein
MALFTIKIKHPERVRVLSFRIHTETSTSDKLYSDSTQTENMITIESDLEVPVVGPNVDIEMEATGDSHLLIKFNVERDGKKLFKNDVQATTIKGRARSYKENVAI